MNVVCALSDLEAAIKRRSRWRGKWVFQQMLEAKLAPTLAASADADGVRLWVEAMLERYSHTPEAPSIPAESYDARGYVGRRPWPS